MYLSDINPHIRLAMRSIITAGHDIARRVIYDYELIYLEQGKFTFVYNDVSYDCQTGDLLFICPGIPHSFHIDRGDISQPHIHFDMTHRPQSEKIPISFKDIGDMTEMEKSRIDKNRFAAYPSNPKIRVKDKAVFLDIFYRILSEETEPLMKKALLIQLLSLIIKDNFPDLLKNQENSSIEVQIKDYLDVGNGLGMNLDDLEKRFFHSKFYLEKKFKKAFGIGIMEYRNQKRMERANDLLDQHSVTEVAELLGYQSIYTFSRAYKQYHGISPNKRNR
jgi:AraC-like DNA-binding protein